MEVSTARTAADWLAEGDAHYAALRWDEAGLAFECALALDPSPARTWYLLGNVREEQGRDPEAVVCFERAIALDPTHARAWNNLGGARQRGGMLDAAIDAYRKAIAASPTLSQPYLNLGRLLDSRGEHARAAECFAAGLESHPGDPSFEHLVAATHGDNTARAPAGYVTTLFDTIAGSFERHLHDLEYRVPEALAALVRPRLEALRCERPAAAPPRVIDLGCGTGLVGMALADTGADIAGVDLSSKMLEVAAGHRVYASLEQGDLGDSLARTSPDSAQAVIAADVFIYLGNLETVFAAVARALAPCGLFAFSVEGVEAADYQLQTSGRYAHSADYVRALAARSGLHVLRLERTPIRRESQGYAAGWLALCRKPAATGEAACA